MANLTSQALLDAVVARYELTIAGPLQAPIIALLDRAIENGSDLGATLLRIPQVRNPLTAEFGGEDGQLDGPGLISAINELQGIVDEVEEASAAISLTADVEAVDEGDAVNFTIEAAEGEDALAEGTEVAYTISGVDADDIDGDLTGTAVIGADGTATVTVNLVEDQVTEGEETLTMSIDVDGTAVSTNVTVNDTSAATTFELSAAQTEINEGASNTFTVTASQPVAEDTTVTFELKIDGETASLADFNAGAFNPVTVTIPAGETEATFDVESISADGTEASETYRVEAVVNGETLSQQVTLLDGTEGAGQTFQLTTGLDILPGMEGSNGNTVTSGNDTVIGTLDGTSSTLNTTDQIDAGDGTDTLRVIAGSGTVNAGAVPNFSNIEILSLNSAGSSTIDYDTSAVEGIEQVNVTAAANATALNAADSVDVSVAGAKGDVDVAGGNDVAVTAGKGDQDITVGEAATVTGVTSTNAAGTITVTDTDQAAGNIAVDGGTDVTVNNTNGTGATTVGGNTAATGSATVNTTLETEGEALAGGATTVTGGESIDITVNASNIADKAADAGTVSVGTITANADDTTTNVSITQNLTNETFTKAASGQVTETASVKFGALKDGDALEVGGLTFKADKDLTAEQVAQAFSELTVADTQDDGGPIANGIYTNALTGWTSAEAAGDTVVFTSTTANTDVADLAPTLTNTSTNSVAPTVTTTQGAAGTAAATSGNTTTAGVVVVEDNATASVTDISIDGYATGSSIVAADALETLNLANSDVGADLEIQTAATALTANVDGVTSSTVDNAVVNLDSSDGLNNNGAPTVTDLTLNASGVASSFILEAQALENLTVAAATDLNISENAGAAQGYGSSVETVTVTGEGNVTLGDISANSKTLDASAATGNISATVDGTKATVTTASGNDSITVDTADLAKNISLGAGDDTLTLSAATANVPTAGTVDGGEGTDTVAMTSASAQALDNNSNFANAIAGFERLTISDQVVMAADADITIDLEALGFDYVTLAQGTDDTENSNPNKLVLDNMANNGTLVLKAAQAATGAQASTQVNVKDAGNNAADVLNLVVEGDATIAAGTVTANDVETLNIAANDVFVDTTNDGVSNDDNNAVHTLTAGGDSVESIVVTGDDLNLTTNSTVLTSVDASAMTGGLIYTANGASAGTTVQGGMGADTLTAAGSNDVLNGGAGNDTLKGANLSQLTGGEGADTFMMNTPSNVNSYSTITDLEAGDVIDLDSGNGGSVVFSSSAVQLAGTAVFQDYANEAVNLLGGDGDDAAWFQFGGNTFIVQSGDTTANNDFQNGVDSIIQIAGEVDLSLASYNQTQGTLEIA